MKKRLSSQTNRVISIVSLSIFIASIILLVIFLVFYYQQYKENISLQQAYQDRVEEYEHIKDIVGNIDENGYYNVYSDGELIIYGEGDDIVLVR